MDPALALGVLIRAPRPAWTATDPHLVGTRPQGCGGTGLAVGFPIEGENGPTTGDTFSR